MPARVSTAIEIPSAGFGSDVLPEIAFAGFGIWTRRRPQNLGHHSHSGLWEINYLVRGQIDEWIDGRNHVVNSGDLFVMAPAVAHSGIDLVRHRAELCWIGVRLPPAVPLPGLDDADQDLIACAFASITPVPFPAGDGMLGAIADLLRPRKPGEDDCGKALRRASLHRILFGIVESWQEFTAGGRQPPPISPAVLAAMTLIRERLAAPLRVESLARAVGLGRSALSGRFVAETGLSPTEWLMRLRIERAQTLLLQSSNAATAYSLGFATAQHFATVFRRHTGLSPGIWRRTASAARLPDPPGRGGSP